MRLEPHSELKSPKLITNTNVINVCNDKIEDKFKLTKKVNFIPTDSIKIRNFYTNDNRQRSKDSLSESRSNSPKRSFKYGKLMDQPILTTFSSDSESSLEMFPSRSSFKDNNNNKLKKIEKYKQLDLLEQEIDNFNIETSGKLQSVQNDLPYIRKNITKGNLKSRFSRSNFKNKNTEYELIKSKFKNIESIPQFEKTLETLKKRNSNFKSSNALLFVGKINELTRKSIKDNTLFKRTLDIKKDSKIKFISQQSKVHLKYNEVDETLRIETHNEKKRQGAFIYGNGEGYHLINKKVIKNYIQSC
jgi:hypothetical protein